MNIQSMKELLLINDNKVNKISYYHLVLLMASLPFDLFYSHIILASFTLHTLIHVKKDRFRSLLSFKLLVLPSVLYISVIATIYTINTPAAFTEWTLRALVLLFPILFLLNELDLKKYRAKLLLFFSLICAATVFYLYVNALFTIRYYHMPLRALFSENFTNHNFAEPIPIHATFFSFQLVIAVVNLLYILMKGAASRVSKVFYAVCCLVLISGIIQLSSKSIVLILFLIINIVLPYYLLTGKSRQRFMLTGFSLSALVVILVLSLSTFRERYVTLFREDLSTDRTIPRNSDTRLERWRVAAQRIKARPILGYGSGSEINLLHNDFYDAKLYSSYLRRLNSHNEFISTWLKSGIWGLLIYLLTLIYGFKLGLQKRDVVFISFMLVIAFVSFSENILDVDKGVMFYAFFFSFFVFSNTENEALTTTGIKSDDYLDSLATNSLPATSY